MLTTYQNIILSIVTIWTLLGAITYCMTNMMLKDKKYNKFYAHPSIKLNKIMKYDKNVTLKDKIFINIALTFLYFTFAFGWFACWCLYKFWKFIYVDDTVELRVEEQITGIDLVDAHRGYDARVEEHSREMEEALNNPEAMPKMDNND